MLRNGVFTTIDVPRAAETVVVGINNNGDIAGYYRDGKDKWHGFVLQSGTFLTIDSPRAKYTELEDERFGANCRQIRGT